MPPRRALLTRGRGATLTLAAALLLSGAGGWLRGLLLPAVADALLAIPWVALRRLCLGFLYDLPTGAVTVLACFAARWLLAVRPVRAAIALAATIWALDALAAALLSHDMSLWSDGLVLLGRAPVLAVTVLGAAHALGYRRARPSPRGDEEEPERRKEAEDEA